MRIAVCGPQNIGKSTFINDFLEAFPMYKTPETSYRDVIKEKKLDVNQMTDVESQRLIRDFIIDQHMTYTSANNIIFDRCILDNLIYTIWKNDKDSQAIPDYFVDQSLQLCRETCKFIDIIFFLPISKSNDVKLEPRDLRDTDILFRSEIDELFKAAIQTYYDQKTLFFDPRDCPAIIEIVGSPEVRIEMAKLYVNPDTGKPWGEKDTLLTSV